MYAYTYKTGSGFFGGVCGQEVRPLTFRDPPHSGIREWLSTSLVAVPTAHRCVSLQI
jgi:hypothetical protein